MPRRPPASRFRPRRAGEAPAAIALAARAGARLAARPDAARLLLALAVVLAGGGLAGFGALADAALHRGVETGAAPPYVQHVTGRDLAANVDLTRFAPHQLPEVATALQASGLRYVRQTFSWAEIEPRPGEFRWDPYDDIVDALTRRGIRPVAVLHRSPAWARVPEQEAAFDAPPTDPELFGRFAQAVVARYGDRVPFVQMWDLPNRPGNWGGQPAEAAAYVTLLSFGSNGAQAANPNATVVLAELDPAPPGADVGSDLTFLRGIYQAAGAPFFDIVAARIDGGGRTPDERRVAADVINLSRATLFRELMIELGDAAKPVWATHYGWRAGEVPGTVDGADQAAFAVAGIERARAEWPWLGPLFTWGLAPGPSLGGEVDPGQALLRGDGSATLLLTALGSFAAAGGTDVAPTGFLPVDARQFDYEGDWAPQHLGGVTYRTTSEVGARFTVRFTGTGVIARVRLSPEAGPVEATLDGEPIAVDLRAGQATNLDVTLADGLVDGPHTLVVRLAAPGQLTIGGLVVEREIPLRWPVMLLVGCGAALLFLGLREIGSTAAERSGRLQRRRGGDLWPELPQLPDWRPARRA